MIQVYDIVKIKLSEKRKYELNLCSDRIEQIKRLVDSDKSEFYVAGILSSQEDESNRLYNLTRLGDARSYVQAAFADLMFLRKPTEEEFRLMLPVKADAPVFEQIEKEDEKQMELF